MPVDSGSPVLELRDVGLQLEVPLLRLLEELAQEEDVGVGRVDEFCLHLPCHHGQQAVQHLCHFVYGERVLDQPDNTSWALRPEDIVFSSLKLIKIVQLSEQMTCVEASHSQHWPVWCIQNGVVRAICGHLINTDSFNLLHYQLCQ